MSGERLMTYRRTTKDRNMDYYRIELTKVKKHFQATRVRKLTEAQQKFEKLVLEVVKDLNKQLKAKKQKGLNISDKYLAEKFDLTKTQSKRVRERLLSEEIVIIPTNRSTGKKMVQTGPGTYPLYLPNKDFSTWVSSEKKTRKVKPVEKRYNSEYCVKWHKEIKEAQEFGLFEIFGTQQAMMLIHINMNEWIAEQGLTRDDFRI